MTLYSVSLAIHSVLRWVVLLAGFAAVVQAAVALATAGSFDKRHKLTNLATMISVDTQLLLGLLLYGVLSPTVTQVVFADFGAAMKDSVLRFWAVEHLTGMLLATVLVHVAYFVAKRAKVDRTKHVWTLVGMGVSMLAIVASIPWPFRAASRALFPGL